MTETKEQVNIIELLMTIREDVSSIKTDMSNFKEVQRSEKEMLMKSIADVRSDYQRELAELENKFMARFNTLQSVQTTLCGDVDTLKNADDKKDAKKYRTILAFIITGLGGMFIAKLPDFIIFLINIKAIGGK